MIEFLLSKLGAIGAGILGVLALWFYGKHQKAKRVEAEEKLYAAETVAEVKDEIKKRQDAVDDKSTDDILNYWGSRLRDKDRDRKAASAPETPPVKFRKDRTPEDE